MSRIPEVIFRMKKRLARQTLGMANGSVRLDIIGVEAAETRIEDGETYHYPETIEIKIENWHNHWFSYRVSDGRWIREGVGLSSSKGFSSYTVYRRMLKEVKAYHAYVAKRKLENNETKGA